MDICLVSYKMADTVLISVSGRASVTGITKEMDELIPLTWHSPANDLPPTYAIFVSKTFDHVLELIRSSGVFVVNFVHYIKPFTCGAHKDTFKEATLTRAECEKIDCVRVQEASKWLECELSQEVDLGDHVLFLGKVLN